MTRALMLQGTGSDVGKSFLTAGLCRALVRRGLAVAPFKPQNMSNNAAVVAMGSTEGGPETGGAPGDSAQGDSETFQGEIGRAQWLQAVAARMEPTVHMNPVLLKPQSDRTSQIIVQGRRFDAATAKGYQQRKETLMPFVLDSFATVGKDMDIVLVEGAGSPAEVNLRARDIANMGFARATDTPVILVGDIDRGGVIAAIAGTRTVLDRADAAMIRGFIINRFRGDVSLFDDGITTIREHTGWPCFGVVPWLDAAADLPAEDAVILERGGKTDRDAGCVIAVPMLSRIANFDDLDPLRAEPHADVVFVPPGRPLPRADLILLPGTKSTVADLAFLRAQGWDIDIHAHVRRGGHVLGVCGGYQMLGRHVHDPDGVDGSAGGAEGLGLLDVETVMAPAKTVRTSGGIWHGHGHDGGGSGAQVTGYEIHMGRTEGPGLARPMLSLDGAAHGAVSADGRIMGCYLHGLFTGDRFRAAFLKRLNAEAGIGDFRAHVDSALDTAAAGLEKHLDIDGLLAVAGL
ncbi:cobyric acid synthase [Eilatimonas milleporae]|nr:cobyric acid synthase [Eilatimonas milleporae]